MAIKSIFETLASEIKAVKNNIEPAVIAKKAVNSFKFNCSFDAPYGNGVALTPPMGWSSWNTFRNEINEDLIFETAKAIKDSGLADCGYQYINIDDCWQSSMRDKNGRLQGDLNAFPSGIKSLVEKVNSLGLKLGIYSSNGRLTCEDLPASLGNEAIDADTFAEWGVEFFKYDFCHNTTIPTSAPKIIKIIISGNGLEKEIELLPDDAVLFGNATVVTDPKISNCRFIDGLSANLGACEFDNVNVSQAGEYILTVVFRKGGKERKHIEVSVNGGEVFRSCLPATKAFTVEGRHQFRIKLDEGNNRLRFFNPVASKQDSAAIQYLNMGKELKRATKEYAEKHNCEEKKIVYSICEWGRNFPWRWGSYAGNLWRTTPDIMPKWFSIIGIYELNVLLYKYAGPGSWNDPDMLEVGNGELTFEENKTHFTLWCMMAAPLILGNDVRKFINTDGTVDKSNNTYKIISNKDLIAIDQDALGMQCRRIKTNGAEDILVKPLVNDEFAVCFLNKATSSASIECSLKEIISKPYITTNSCSEYITKDLWTGEEFGVFEKIKADVPGHGVKIYKVRVK